MSYLKVERFVLVKLNQDHGKFVVEEHRFALVIKPSVLKRGDQVFYRLPFDTYIWGKNVIANCQGARNHLDASSVQ